MDVSICIVNYNTKDLLRACLLSIYERVVEVRFEVIIVDNASSDGSVEMVESIFPSARLVKNRENTYYVGGNRQAVALARGRYIFILNSDTELTDRHLSQAIQYLNQHPEVGCLSPKIINPDGSILHTNVWGWNFWLLLATYSHLFAFLPGMREFALRRVAWRGWDRTSIEEIGCFFGGCALFPAEVLRGVALFDPRFRMYFTEFDQSSALKRAAWKMIYFPGFVVMHVGQASSRKVRKQVLNRMILEDLLSLQRKHGSWVGYAVLAALMRVELRLRSLARKALAKQDQSPPEARD
ncbi:MAG: glycosyltransferase family 2 protein [Candidatus Sumerlaeota bacterium]|nr:glycosyltransferase family 2 protein [Candidatus Sumerlaeota bacterium]